jgi:hypothetical protein
LADALDLGSSFRKGVRVQISPGLPTENMKNIIVLNDLDMADAVIFWLKEKYGIESYPQTFLIGHPQGGMGGIHATVETKIKYK